MAEIVFIESNVHNTIVGIHYQEIDASKLPENHVITEAEVEDPAGLLGLDVSLISQGLDKRPATPIVPSDIIIRSQLRSLSIELDLMERLSEDTTAKQAEFDTLKAQYEAL